MHIPLEEGSLHSSAIIHSNARGNKNGEDRQNRNIILGAANKLFIHTPDNLGAEWLGCFIIQPISLSVSCHDSVVWCGGVWHSVREK